ncbi:hypothetical protein [Maribellus sediminis]|uniref:hypothetical protein n=1 Tax=Maribellus sediminis TaxID=2696285 RepID=UPI0014304B09|nr:hypothetical protein [Maribellus sediminis]
MTKDEIKILAKIEKEKKRVYNKSRKCFHPFCDKTAINSHVLQKNAFISAIADEGHVYEYEHLPFKEQNFHFKKSGINEVFTFKGFCSFHDDFLFRDIEKKEINFYDYKTLLIFAHRILAQEITKKKNVIEFHESLIQKNIGDSQFFKENISGQRLGIQDANYTLKKVLNNIKNPELKEFNFHTREIKQLEICASGPYTFETTREQNEMHPEIYALPLTDIFVNILPTNGNTTVSFCYLNSNNLKCNTYIKSKFQLPEVEFIKFLSDILVAQMENWVISTTLYEKVKEDEKILFNITQQAFNTDDERFEIDYNLFK